MKTLECEAVYHSDYRIFDGVAANLPRLIEETYGEKRLHSALGYLGPATFDAINRPERVKSAA